MQIYRWGNIVVHEPEVNYLNVFGFIELLTLPCTAGPCRCTDISLTKNILQLVSRHPHEVYDNLQ